MIRTTVIGSFPKPSYLALPDWFKSSHVSIDPRVMTAHLEQADKDPSLARAIDEAVACQCKCGIDCVTDGEMGRENYIHHFCRQIEGISFEDIRQGQSRGGACQSLLPTIVGPVSGPKDGARSCVLEFRRAAKAALAHGAQVKFTLPGPMTIMDTLVDAHYADRRPELAFALAEIVRAAVQALVEAGCEHIQIDEPVFARQVQDAVDFGIPALERVLDGAGAAERTVHMCCGYPIYLDQDDYMHANASAYLELAPHLDACQAIDVISIEDAHRPNDLAALLPLFQRIKVCFGVVAIAKSRVESQEQIEARLREALQYIPRERLIVAPDCGLGFLPADLLEAKLSNLCGAVRAVNADMADASTDASPTSAESRSTEASRPSSAA